MERAADTERTSGPTLPKPSAKVTLRCAGCGKTFERYKSQIVGARQYCSIPCRAEDRAYRLRLKAAMEPRRLPDRECAWCGEPFRPAGERRFCSLPCAYEARRKHPKPSKRVCAFEGCERRFTPTGPQLSRGQGTYCSKTCEGAARRKRELVRCAHCGDEFSISSKLHRQGQRFCSRSCWHRYRWRHGVAVSPELLAGKTMGRARQRWQGRWAGKKYGKLGGRPQVVATAEQRTEIENLAAQGWGRRAIANRLLVSERLVRNVLFS